MGLKSMFSKMLGGGNPGPTSDAGVEYKGYMIRPVPKPQGGQFYTAGNISESTDIEARQLYFIRADTHTTRGAAADHAISKAKQIIDEQGDKLFKS